MMPYYTSFVKKIPIKYRQYFNEECGFFCEKSVQIVRREKNGLTKRIKKMGEIVHYYQ